MALQRDRSNCNQHEILNDIAHQAMIDRGLEPDFGRRGEKQAESISERRGRTDSLRDLRDLLWCSIDNDDSRDLDQLTVAEDLGGGNVRAMVAVADVDALVKKGTPIDDHARAEHDLGLHRRADLSDAAGEAVDRSDVAQRGRGADRDGHRHGRRVRRLA